MVQAQDLRIGNYVMFDEDIDTVTAVNGLMCQGLNHSHWYCERLHPIPLTNEVLEMWGFVRAYESVHDEIVILNLHNERLDFQYNTEFDKGIAVSYKDEDNAMMFHCTALHQLQNLYFALTRQELEYKQ